MTTQNIEVDNWKTLPWKRFQKTVFRLQVRIFKARKNRNHKLVRKLQKLLLNSKAAKYLAVRQVTQLNQGKATAGVDGKTALNPKERVQLASDLTSGWKSWKHQPLRRVSIPKKDGTKRKLGIPTIRDRAYQCLLKYALEPAAEATFHGNSYGFRPGRSAHDVQKRLFAALNSQGKGITKTILEMDIEKCFDRISHEAIMSKVQLPNAAQRGLRRAIKAGVKGEFPASTEGTPQGGVISPLLANIALNGIEEIGGKDVTCLRYADDLVYICKPGVNPSLVMNQVASFLTPRGLRIKESKTRVVKTTEGFDFLGWNFKVKPNGKFISTPAKDSTKKVKAKVKETMKDSRFTLEQRVAKCGSLIRGWRNYNQFCDMSDDNLWAQALWTWKFIRKQGRYDRQGTTGVMDKAFPSVSWKVNDHISVIGDKSVFDGNLPYWAKRGNKNYSGIHASLLKNQNYKCQACGLTFLSDDKVELHHKDGNHANWKKTNLEMLHRHCHQHKPIHGEARVARNLAAKARK
ncbi:MAG TPA: group II intron reverse transcriptase/maturase [Coleofasciculaceae cyanobacterium]|jgi:group II intron reverse transcriptase/maturase